MEPTTRPSPGKAAARWHSIWLRDIKPIEPGIERDPDGHWLDDRAERAARARASRAEREAILAAAAAKCKPRRSFTNTHAETVATKQQNRTRVGLWRLSLYSMVPRTRATVAWHGYLLLAAALGFYLHYGTLSPAFATQLTETTWSWISSTVSHAFHQQLSDVRHFWSLVTGLKSKVDGNNHAVANAK